MKEFMAFSNRIFIKTPDLSLAEAATRLGQKWSWLFAAGLAYVGLGIVALMVPAASSLGLILVLGGFLVAGGIVHLIQAVQLRDKQGGLVRFLQSIVALAIGAFVLWHPGVGMLGITLALSFYFLVSAVMQWLLAWAMPMGSARGWFYMGVAVSFMFGVYIILTLPISAFWVPGTLLGIEFLFSGSGLIGLAIATRKLYRKSIGLDNKTSSHFSGGMHPTGPSM
jgi:uncharacterized membrane protein HdeD (DUF308 family)